jgi:hypothetical protein
MNTRTQRFEGGSWKSKLGESSKLCSRPEDTFYQFCYWAVPSLSQHITLQCWPYVSGYAEAKPREYNA